MKVSKTKKTNLSINNSIKSKLHKVRGSYNDKRLVLNCKMMFLNIGATPVSLLGMQGIFLLSRKPTFQCQTFY